MEIGRVQETEFGGDRGEYRRLSLMKIGRVQETGFGGDRGSTGD